MFEYDRFDWAAALWQLCSQYHSGQGSRGYRILSRLSAAGYSPGLTVQSGGYESEAHRELYLSLAWKYRHSL